VKCEKTAKYGVPDKQRMATFGPLLELSKIHSRLLSALEKRVREEKMMLSDLFLDLSPNLGVGSLLLVVNRSPLQLS
jgi:hypothetical protein